MFGGSGSSDECYLCGEVVDPFDNLQGDRLPEAGRSWYRCEGEHPSGDFYWWSDRIDGTIVERIAFDPSQPMMGQPIPLDRAYLLRRMAEEPQVKEEKRHDERARFEVSRYGGRYVGSTGDGLFATFNGPARAVTCAQAIAQTVADLGIQIRSGVHTGEVEIDGDDVRGIAVHIGARVAALAGPSVVLVSQTVKDLVAGSGLTFEDAGEHELKGVPDRWHLYRVVG